MANWKERSMDLTHLAGKPNSFSKSNAPPRAHNLMACEADVKRSMRWFPSGDLMTNSTCLSICFCWVSLLTGSIMLRPERISSSTPSRKILSQLPGPPAAIPLITIDFFINSSSSSVSGHAVAAGICLPCAWISADALDVTQFIKAGLKVWLSPYISVPVQSIWIPDEIKLANKSLNSTIPPFLGWLEATTLISFLSANVLVAKAESTRLGPHSTNKRTPESYVVFNCLIHSTEWEICVTIKSLIFSRSDG